MASPAESILAYVMAKDGNRPHLLNGTFASDVVVQMRVLTDSISFPPLLEGREAIAETLVRKFNQTYENIYTFCIGAPPASDAESFSCDWIVAMSEKQGGAVRIGCGVYDWSFVRTGARVKSLDITIAAMEILPPDALAPVMNWLSKLPYPWCGLQAVVEAPPSITGLDRVLGILRQARN